MSKIEKKVNKEIVNYVVAVLSGTTKSNFKLIAVSNREAKDIKKLTDIDIKDFSRYLIPDSVRHIIKRHGVKGSADSSMQDIDDIAIMEYVLANYDTITLLEKGARPFLNKDGTHAKAVRYQKKINGNYYIAEAIPDTKKKELIVMTAYKSAK
ncbi:MAG: hypothetical protein FWE22_01195 [Firmicutes bacterium]|nr:hypothetical protein [Bacillota bacterium]